jgi:hypothetical protein
MTLTSDYDLERYMHHLFQMSYPSSGAALEGGFGGLKQSHSTMIQYVQRHITFCEYLDRNVNTQNQKWIEGLNSDNIKQALLRGRFSTLDFQELLTYACELEHAGLQSQPQAYCYEQGALSIVGRWQVFLNVTWNAIWKQIPRLFTGVPKEGF